MDYNIDSRIVLTLRAGEMDFVFSAIKSCCDMVAPVRLPAETRVLEKCLETMRSGFEQVIEQLDEKPVAISFAFPGPADYPNGIIDNGGLFPAFEGGVPLGSWLEKQFGIPVFINSDSNLFVYGEAVAGLLPRVNQRLAEAGNPKRYKTLFGITISNELRGGMVHNETLYVGDNSIANEVWLLRNKVRPECFIEEGASIRGVRNIYARNSGIDPADAPSPKEIGDIALGKVEGNMDAAIEAYRELGKVIGEALAVITTLFDGLIVIGGGLSFGHELFMPTVLATMNGTIRKYDGSQIDRVVQRVFNLEDVTQQTEFLWGEIKRIKVPGSARTMKYDPLKRVGIGTSVLGTHEAVTIGAYAFALHEIDL